MIEVVSRLPSFLKKILIWCVSTVKKYYSYTIVSFIVFNISANLQKSVKQLVKKMAFQISVGISDTCERI